MYPNELIQKVINSKIFKQWHKDEYLVGLFFMDNILSVNFYSKKSKKINSFFISNKIEMAEDNIFQKQLKI